MEIDSATRLRRSPATWCLLGLAGFLTALPVASAVTSVLKASGYLDVDREAALRDGLSAVGLFNDERSLRIAEGFAAVVSIPVAVTALIVLLGLALWKDWAREAALGVFGLTGLLLLVFSLNGLSQGGRNAGLGTIVSLLVLGVAALVLSPPVRDDFERRRLQKELREREALAAARRARIGS